MESYKLNNPFEIINAEKTNISLDRSLFYPVVICSVLNYVSKWYDYLVLTHVFGIESADLRYEYFQKTVEAFVMVLDDINSYIDEKIFLYILLPDNKCCISYNSSYVITATSREEFFDIIKSFEQNSVLLGDRYLISTLKNYIECTPYYTLTTDIS